MMIGADAIGRLAIGEEPPSGNTYNVDVTEVATATDSASAVAVLPATRTEAATATDTPSAVGIYPATATEAATATDAPSALGTYPASRTETATATDLTDALTLGANIVVEAATATDTSSALSAFGVAQTEAANAADTSDATLNDGRRPGAGKRINPIVGPEPAYDVKPAKRYQPIWDKVRAQKIAARNAELARRNALPVPLPPADPNFNRPIAVPKAPPNFAHLVPPDPMGIERRLRDARDMTDIADVASAIDLLAGLGLVSPPPQ